MKMEQELRRELKTLAQTLETYQHQLLLRHGRTPLKSPPLFLLQLVMRRLRELAAEAHSRTH
jgi:hypothetical protein